MEDLQPLYPIGTKYEIPIFWTREWPVIHITYIYSESGCDLKCLCIRLRVAGWPRAKRRVSHSELTRLLGNRQTLRINASFVYVVTSAVPDTT